MLAWLKRVFVPAPPTDADAVEAPELEEGGSSFVWNEHMRIVLAMLVVILSAGVMWWILV